MSGTGGLSYESMQTPLELSPLKTQIIFFRKWMQNTWMQNKRPFVVKRLSTLETFPNPMLLLSVQSNLVQRMVRKLASITILQNIFLGQNSSNPNKWNWWPIHWSSWRSWSCARGWDCLLYGEGGRRNHNWCRGGYWGCGSWCDHCCSDLGGGSSHHWNSSGSRQGRSDCWSSSFLYDLGCLVLGSALAILLPLSRATVVWLHFCRRWGREGGNGMRGTGGTKFAGKGHGDVALCGFQVERSIFTKIPHPHKLGQSCNHKLWVVSCGCHLHWPRLHQWCCHTSKKQSSIWNCINIACCQEMLSAVRFSANYSYLRMGWDLRPMQLQEHRSRVQWCKKLVSIHNS